VIRIFVGYDPREAIGYPVFCSSVMARTDEAVSFTPVRGEKTPESSTSFNYGRFDVAEQCGYRGWAIWAECDMLARADIAELWAMRRIDYDVMVVKHDYRTRHPVKFLGQKNEDYPRKNWSSLMLINCAGAAWQRMRHHKGWTGPELHRLAFLNDARIGALAPEWNHLVGEYAPNPQARIAHFTIGLPCWQPYDAWEFGGEWAEELAATVSFAEGS
jgi:hypothetical protein